ncbi:MAG: 30S ribosomal protein S16 [Bacteroidetes bacterium]|nr:MAG: 30S ribosomal protein S16 [Bacteroidota bacterium]
MATRIRLQRHGRKRRAIFTIVVADQRAKRDGRYIEKIGQYNPNTNPATIDLNFDKAVEWVMSGAQPSDTVRAILSYKGVMMKKHLLEGVKKGALTEDQVEEKFNAWLEAKENRIQAKREGLVNATESQKKARLEAEAEVNKKRAEAIAAKNAPEAPAEEEVAEEAAAEATEEAPEATTEEAPAAEGEEKAAE